MSKRIKFATLVPMQSELMQTVAGQLAKTLMRDVALISNDAVVLANYPQDRQMTLDELSTTLEKHKQESESEPKCLKTFYCLFIPLGIYCEFGAENVYHAYNRAAKLWGAKTSFGTPIAPNGEYIATHRLMVYQGDKALVNKSKVSHTLMTDLVKTWKANNHA
jgi:hypothetical protein